MFSWSNQNKEAEKIKKEADELEKKKKLDEEIEKLTGTKYETSNFKNDNPTPKPTRIQYVQADPMLNFVSPALQIQKQMRIDADAIKKEISDHVDKELKRLRKAINEKVL